MNEALHPYAPEAQSYDFLGIFKRRRKFILWPAVIIFLGFALVALLLPSIYRSDAIILIESQEIPEELVKTTVSGYVEERIKTISQLVLTRSNLLDIIEKVGLYQDEMRTKTSDEVLDEMRKAIIIEPIRADIVNPTTGKASTATIAFNIGFEGKLPRKVLDVTNHLVSLYLEENLANRKQKVDTAYDFLDQELADSRAKIIALEQEMAAFKEKNLHSLPELLELNLQNLERVQKEIDARKAQVANLQDRLVYLQGQLATARSSGGLFVDAKGRVLTAEEQYEALRNEYLLKKASLSEDHPEVKRLQRELEAFAEYIADRDLLRQIRQDLASKQMELRRLEKIYSLEHPDVVRLSREVRELNEEALALQEKLNRFESSAMNENGGEEEDSPTAINLRTQVTSAEMELAANRQVLGDLQGKYEDYVQRIERSPQVESEFRMLQRDYANEQAQYQDILNRLQAAKEAQGLEEQRIAEKLSIIEAPELPIQPIKPNRILLLLVGLVLGIGTGLGIGILAEQMDRSVHSSEDLARLTNIPVLTVVPSLQTMEEQQAQGRKRKTWIWLVVLAVVAAVAVVHFVYMPLDLLFMSLMRKIGINL